MEDYPIFEELCDILRNKPALTRQTEDGSPTHIWSDGEMILCESKLVIDLIADLLNSAGYVAVTGYYDPEEEQNVSCPSDEYTGNYYVDV